MNLCWRTLLASGSYSAYERLKYSNNTAFSITLTNITATTQAWPHILEFSHRYGSVISTTDTLWFSFANSTSGHSNVVPSNNPYDSSNGLFQVATGTYCIFTVVDVSSSSVLNQTFDGSFSPNQGFISCQKSGEQSGKWFIENLTLTDDSTVWLVFYSNSFSYTDGINRYYLFGDQVKTTVHYIHYLYVKNYFISSQSSTNNIYTYLKDT